MIFYVSRILLLSVICFLAVVGIRKSKIARKKVVCALAVILCFASVTASAVFPVENLFVSFGSPESVFDYTHLGKAGDIVYGKNSCMVIYTDRSSTGGHYIVPKTEKGCRIPGYFYAKRISHKFDKNGSFDVYKASGTDDCYIVGVIISDSSEPEIVDDRNEPVENTVIKMDDTDTNTVIVYAYTENFSNDYCLYIDGVKTAVAD